MPKSKLQKQEILRDLKEKISKSKSVVFAQFNTLTVKDNEVLRKDLKKENSEYYVAKKTLFEIAFKEKNISEGAIRGFDGKIAAIFGYGDEVAPAKVVDKFLHDKEKENKIAFVGGIIADKFMSAAEMKQIAKLPSKLELYSQLVGSLNAPISGFVNVLAGNMRGLLTVLKAIEEKKA
jgi:large subunit ribosomal protein L10